VVHVRRGGAARGDCGREQGRRRPSRDVASVVSRAKQGTRKQRERSAKAHPTALSRAKGSARRASCLCSEPQRPCSELLITAADKGARPYSGSAPAAVTVTAMAPSASRPPRAERGLTSIETTFPRSTRVSRHGKPIR
jgi:hypothetical protein